MAGRGKTPMTRIVPTTHSSSLGPQQRQESQAQRSTSSTSGALHNQSNRTTSSGPSHLQIPRHNNAMRDAEMQTDSPHIEGGGNPHNETEEPMTPVSSAASTNLPDLWVEYDHFMPEDLPVTKAISELIKAHFQGVWPTLSDVPEYDRNMWWIEFKSKYNIPPQYLQAVKKRYNTKLSDRFTDKLKNARDKWYTEKKKPGWIEDKWWKPLLEYWDGEYFQHRSQVNKDNRNRVTEDGRFVAKHTGGSISAHDTRVRMEKKLKRRVSQAEVFYERHTKKKNKQPVDSIAAAVQEALSSKLPEIVPLLGQPETQLTDDVVQELDETLVQCLGRPKRGRISGLGNLSQECGTDRSACTFLLPPSHQVQELRQQVTQLTEENQGLHGELDILREKQADQDAEMKRKLEEQARIIEETVAARAAEIEQRAAARADADFAKLMAHFAKFGPTFTGSHTGSGAS